MKIYFIKINHEGGKSRCVAKVESPEDAKFFEDDFGFTRVSWLEYMLFWHFDVFPKNFTQ